MTTSELAGTISACIDSSGTLTLAGDALGSTTMAAVFATCLTNGTLIIDGASVTTTGEDVTVTGNGTDRFAALAVTAVFVPLESGDVQATVTGVTTAGWTFSTAFSSLSGGIYDEVPVAAGGSLALRTLADGDFPAGFWFAGSLEVAGALAEISYFLGEHTTLAVLGAITVIYGIPEFHFGAAAGLGVTVGTLSGLDFTLNANCAPPQGGATDTATQDAYLSLSTSLSFSAKGAPETVSASMRCGTGADAQIILVATLDSNPGVLLDDFLDWAGTSLSVGMPDPSLFDPSNDLTVSGISFTIVQSTGEMVSFDLTVSTTDAWGIIPALIAVTDVSLTLTSSSPAKNPSVSGAIHGAVLLGADGDVAQIDVQGTAPGYVISGKLAEGCEVDVSALAALLIPAAIGIPSIQLTNFDFTCQDSAAPYYNVEADFQSDWNLDLSVVGLAITGASIKFDYGSPAGSDTPSGTASGSISGTIVLNDDISFDITYDIPGEFKIAGAIATISLTALVARLVDMAMTLPAGFDLTLSNSSVLIVYGNDGATLEFQIGTQIDGLGSVVFEALKVGTNWGYALGLSLGSVRLSDVPGLSALAPFDDFFSFQEGVLVVSTAALNDFAFPDTSVFDNSAITSPQIQLPTAQGVVAGMNTYASIDLGGQKELSLLQNFLSLPATLDVTVQIGLDDVTTGSALYVSVSGDINSSTSLTGNFGAKLIGGVLELYMTGIVTSIIQGQTTVFDFTLAFVENGAFLSGGYQGTIDFVIVEISNLVIEIGIDWEGVPTLGFGAQIDVEDFNTSVMILLDSAVPTQSMFVASISNRTLATVLQSLCNLTDTSGVPESIMGVLAAVGLSGTNYFTIDDTADTLAASLNSRDVAAISAAFAMDGTWLSTDSQEVIVSVADEGTLWYVTDMVNVLHYQLTKSGAGAAIQVSLNAQFYVVPPDDPARFDHRRARFPDKRDAPPVRFQSLADGPDRRRQGAVDRLRLLPHDHRGFRLSGPQHRIGQRHRRSDAVGMHLREQRGNRP